MDGRPWLIASLLYGTGMRLMVWREARRWGCGPALRRTRRAVRPDVQGRALDSESHINV